ncbi:MAG: hypothetical protein ACYCW6_26930 [Candidatus Xenobia bacterium]
MIGQIMRSTHDAYRFATSFSFPPSLVATLLVPYGTRLSGAAYHEFSIFMGDGPTLLALVGLLLRRSHAQRPFWAVMLVLSLGLTLGSNGPVFPALAWLPGMTAFRVPARWWLIGSLAIATLAAFSLDALLQAPADEREREWAKGNLVTLAVMLLLLAVRIQGVSRMETTASSAIVLGLWCLLSLALWQKRHVLALAVVVLSLLEMATFVGRYVAFTPDAQVHDQVAALEDQHRDGQLLPGCDPKVSALYGHWTVAFHLRSAQGSNPLGLERTMQFLFAAVAGRGMTMRDRFGMATYQGFLGQPMQPQNSMMGMLDVRRELRFDHGRVQAVDVPGGVGAGWVVGAVRVEPPDSIRDDLGHGRFDPHRMLLLEAPSRFAGDPAARGSVTRTSFAQDSIRYTVSASAPAWAVTSEVYYPGWYAWVDGHPTPVVPAYTLLRACPVPAGQHVLELRYLPWWRHTFWIAAVTLLLTCGLAVGRES